jgi:hypothetical protein
VSLRPYCHPGILQNLQDCRAAQSEPCCHLPADLSQLVCLHHLSPQPNIDPPTLGERGNEQGCTTNRRSIILHMRQQCVRTEPAEGYQRKWPPVTAPGAIFMPIVDGSVNVSLDISTVLPAVDPALAVGVSLPNYDASLFLNNLPTGNLLATVGDPIAADTALVPFLIAFGGLAPVGEALATTGYDLFGGLVSVRAAVPSALGVSSKDQMINLAA